MCKKACFVSLIFVVLIVSLLASCSKSSISTSSTTTTAEIQQTTGSSTTQSIATTTTTTPENWWDSLGEPAKGGTLYWRKADLPALEVKYNYVELGGYHLDGLFKYDWTVDHAVWDYKASWIPEEYWTGCLVEKWDWPDAQTLILHIRQGVHWQDKAPLNGREFTANDVEFYFDRLMGTGHGFTEPDPYSVQWITAWEKAAATDDYTIELNFKQPTAIVNHWSMFENVVSALAAPESMQQGTGDWQECVGTGPWMVTDYVTGSSMTLTKNPDYWGVDERHPQNQLPYLDEVKILNIKDIATSLAAFRTGKVYQLDSLDWQQAQILSKSNPELEQTQLIVQGFNFNIKDTNTPFTDIRVRQALQMAVDRSAIAESHYGGTVEGNPTGLIAPNFTGYVTPYDQWSEDIKNEYAYNPTRSKELLAEAGYPDGFTTQCTVISSMDQALPQIVKAQLMDIGVDMELVVMEMAAAFPLLRTGKWDGLFMSIAAAGQPPLIALSNAVRNHPSDTAFSDLVGEFQKSSTTNEAQQYIKEADMYWIQKHYLIEMFPVSSYTFWQPYLNGYSGEAVTTRAERGTAFYWARMWLDQTTIE